MFVLRTSTKSINPFLGGNNMALAGVGSATGNLTALNQAVTVNAAPIDKIGISITGTFTATVSFEATLDGTNWVAVAAGAGATPATPVTTATAPGVFVADCYQFVGFRVRCSAFTSGTAAVVVTTATVNR
jgi:hypothetical protein